MVNQIGIMQGRLTSPKGRKNIQFMPYGVEIVNEFERAKFLGLDYVEYLIPKGNPVYLNLFLGSFDSQEEIKWIIKTSKVKINSVCLDYLMDLDLRQGYDLAFATDIINWIANIASNIGCEILVIPIYVKNIEDFLCAKYLIANVIERYDLKVAFEFLDSNSFTGINFINDLCYVDKLQFRDNNKIGCCFDIGNNYERDIIEEMKNYNKYNMLYHIHIKEKNTLGESVELGKGVIGEVGWRRIFKFLKQIKYSGGFTLQVARGEDGKEIETVKKQLIFLKDLL